MCCNRFVVIELASKEQHGLVNPENIKENRPHPYPGAQGYSRKGYSRRPLSCPQTTNQDQMLQVAFLEEATPPGSPWQPTKPWQGKQEDIIRYQDSRGKEGDKDIYLSRTHLPSMTRAYNSACTPSKSPKLRVRLVEEARTKPGLITMPRIRHYQSSYRHRHQRQPQN